MLCLLSCFIKAFDRSLHKDMVSSPKENMLDFLQGSQLIDTF